MIGARRMAFPRLEALSFWVVPPAAVILAAATFWGGFPTGWTGYPPLSEQAGRGWTLHRRVHADRASRCALRREHARHHHRSACPGNDLDAAADLRLGGLHDLDPRLLAAPVLSRPRWSCGHGPLAEHNLLPGRAAAAPLPLGEPVLVLRPPRGLHLHPAGFGIIMEIVPHFARKPLWGYRTAVVGLFGVALLSWFVWQHHLFVSGIAPVLRPFYMLSTELISIPTGIIFLVTLGTLWRARDALTVPMLFCLGFLFNFLIGGISGVYLSDVPTDVTLHGTLLLDGPLPLHDRGRRDLCADGRRLLLAAEDDRDAEPGHRRNSLLDDVHILQLDLLPAVHRRLAEHAPPGLDL